MIGCVYTVNGTLTGTCFYVRNLQGDVIGIYDSSGNKLAEYEYDAFGNCTTVYGLASSIGKYNPIRYRGYYCDIETGWYFLNSRYYAPELRRFISPANVSAFNPKAVNGLNLYCYAGNNPVVKSLLNVPCIPTQMNLGSSTFLINNQLHTQSFDFLDLSFLSSAFGLVENVFSMVAGVIDGVRDIQGLDKLVKLETISDVLMWVGIGLNASLSIYDNFTNKLIGSRRQASNILGDFVYIGVSGVATWGSAKLIAMIPKVGLFIAPLGAIVVGIGFDQLWHGEDFLSIDGWSININGKTIDQWIKDLIYKWIGG